MNYRFWLILVPDLLLFRDENNNFSTLRNIIIWVRINVTTTSLNIIAVA